jgi:hypothetical protein
MFDGAVAGRVACVLDAERARALDTQPGIGVEITRIDQQTEEAFRTYVEQLMRHYT